LTRAESLLSKEYIMLGEDFTNQAKFKLDKQVTSDFPGRMIKTKIRHLRALLQTQALTASSR